MENLGCFPQGKASCNRVTLPTYSACWMFLWSHNSPNADMDYRIYNVRTGVNVCDCPRGCMDTPRESPHWKFTLGEKSLATLWNGTCMSGVLVRHCTSWVTSLPCVLRHYAYAIIITPIMIFRQNKCQSLEGGDVDFLFFLTKQVMSSISMAESLWLTCLWGMFILWCLWPCRL